MTSATCLTLARSVLRTNWAAPVEYKPEFDDLRTSVGIGVQWLAPLGLFRFSYAYPLNAYTGNDRYFGDELERFQFSIGQAF